MSKAITVHNEQHVGRSTADSVWQPGIEGNPFRVSEVGSAARREIVCEVAAHSERLALPVAVFGRDTFAVPLFQGFSVTHRRPHHGLAEPPTPRVLSGAVDVASV